MFSKKQYIHKNTEIRQLLNRATFGEKIFRSLYFHKLYYFI